MTRRVLNINSIKYKHYYSSRANVFEKIAIKSSQSVKVVVVVRSS